jgi:nitrate reductase beta subunit
MAPGAVERMFRLLAIAKFDERYVIPKAHGELGVNPHTRQGAGGMDFPGGPGSERVLAGRPDPFGDAPLDGGAGRGQSMSFVDFRKRQP